MLTYYVLGARNTFTATFSFDPQIVQFYKNKWGVRWRTAVVREAATGRKRRENSEYMYMYISVMLSIRQYRIITCILSSKV